MGRVAPLSLPRGKAPPAPRLAPRLGPRLAARLAPLGQATIRRAPAHSAPQGPRRGPAPLVQGTRLGMRRGLSRQRSSRPGPPLSHPRSRPPRAPSRPRRPRLCPPPMPMRCSAARCTRAATQAVRMTATWRMPPRRRARPSPFSLQLLPPHSAGQAPHPNPLAACLWTDGATFSRTRSGGEH